MLSAGQVSNSHPIKLKLHSAKKQDIKTTLNVWVVRKHWKKGCYNIKNEQCLYFVIILLFVLVDKLFKKSWYTDGSLSAKF